MLRLMHDAGEQAFFDLQEPGSRKLRIATPTIFFALAVEEVPQDLARAMVEVHFGSVSRPLAHAVAPGRDCWSTCRGGADAPHCAPSARGLPRSAHVR
jgi:hypothetical protein